MDLIRGINARAYVELNWIRTGTGLIYPEPAMRFFCLPPTVGRCPKAGFGYASPRTFVRDDGETGAGWIGQARPCPRYSLTSVRSSSLADFGTTYGLASVAPGQNV